ncbi:MAG TPA: LD-carboxypeptidase [Planctomycetota bacterium]|nr:LD-carboxypeptidase [Planctomycetota bacterium]
MTTKLRGVGAALGAALFLAFAGAQQPAQPQLHAPALEKGDTIALVSPAGPLAPESVKAASEALKRRGYTVRWFDGRSKKRGYLAGSDEERAAAFNAAVHDPDVKAIICLRGGYGSPRILDRIDYAQLRSHPKVVVGYSDITALLIAIEKESGLVVFHGPMGKEWSASRGGTPFTQKYFWPLVEASAAGSPALPAFADWGGDRAHGMKAPSKLVGGSTEGILRGGNLSVVCATLGTPYELDARGAVLFLEEVGEKPFRIDRMLNQLRLSGKLAQARGILLGVFAGCDATDPDGDLSVSDLFLDYFSGLKVPVLFDFPAGHVPDMVTLPLGLKVRLDADAAKLTLLEPAVEAPTPAREGKPAAAE